MACNDLKYSDGKFWAKSVDQDETAATRSTVMFLNFHTDRSEQTV